MIGYYVYNDEKIIRSFKEETNREFHNYGSLNPKDIELYVREYVCGIILDYELDMLIRDVVITGSRCRGKENRDSDLDIVLYYSGDIREDFLFNLFHSDELRIEGVEVDINPVSYSETGSLSDYLLKVEEYLSK